MVDLICFPDVTADRRVAYQSAAGSLKLAFASSEEEALTHCAQAHGLIGRITPKILAHAPQLAWVQSPTASLEHYIFPELVTHPCTLTNVAGIFGDVIAEHVLGYVLSFTRNLHLYRDHQSANAYRPVGADEFPPDFVAGPATVGPVDRAHRRIAECSFLIVGLGGIGRDVANALSHFRASIDGVDPEKKRGTGVERVHPPDALPAIIGAYDFVIIAAPHTPETEGLFDDELIATMKKGSVLINVGRGAIVRQSSVERGLLNGHLGGAALDVLESEPLPSDSRLWSMPNVLITPHVAAACDAISERQAEVIVENIARFAAGRQLLNVVNKALWY